MFTRGMIIRMLVILSVGFCIGVSCGYLCGRLRVEAREMRHARQGEFIQYHESGMPAEFSVFSKDVQVGESAAWWPSGQEMWYGRYVNGRPEGIWMYWHANGQLMSSGDFRHGQPWGTAVEYDYSGRVVSIARMTHGLRDGQQIEFDWDRFRVLVQTWDMGDRCD